MFDRLRQSQGAHEVGEIVSQGVKLEPHLVVAELAAGQPRPLDGVFAFLNPLFRRGPVIVEGDDPFGRTAQVSDDEADCRVKLVWMPFDLGDHAAFLEKAGHHVDGVGNGRKALGTVQNTPIDLVLMDVEMPAMDGVETTKAIRGLEGAVAELPIIAVTARVGPGFADKYVDLGMNGYVAKPIKKEELLHIVESWGDRKG